VQSNRTLFVAGIAEIVIAAALVARRYPLAPPIGAIILLLSLAFVSGIGCGMRYVRGEWGMPRLVRFGVLWPIITAILFGVSLAAVVHYENIQPMIMLGAILSEVVFITGVLSRTRAPAASVLPS
jgi:hypothetical protein